MLDVFSTSSRWRIDFVRSPFGTNDLQSIWEQKVAGGHLTPADMTDSISFQKSSWAKNLAPSFVGLVHIAPADHHVRYSKIEFDSENFWTFMEVSPMSNHDRPGALVSQMKPRCSLFALI